MKSVKLAALLLSSLALAGACGSSDDEENPLSTAGGSGMPSGGSGGRGGSSGSSGSFNSSGGSTATPNSTECDDENAGQGEPCSDNGLVCPSALGSCVCDGDSWTCYEIGVGSIDGQGGESSGGAPGSAGAAGEGGGGQSSAAGAGGQGGGSGGQAGAPGLAGTGGA